jgi:hypothetical protein
MAVGGSVVHGATPIGTAATLILAGFTLRKSVSIQNHATTAIFWVGGSNTVTTATGTRVRPGETVNFTDYNGPVWGIADTASTDVRWLEVRF